MMAQPRQLQCRPKSCHAARFRRLAGEQHKLQEACANDDAEQRSDQEHGSLLHWCASELGAACKDRNAASSDHGTKGEIGEPRRCGVTSEATQGAKDDRPDCDTE